MVQCCVCGTRFKSKEAKLVYGCKKCQKGSSTSRETTYKLIEVKKGK